MRSLHENYFLLKTLEQILFVHWLSIETSSQRVSMAIGNGTECIREIAKKGNASTLIESIYRELDIPWEKIQQCVIGQGPGSYNGLRVGYSFLKGLLCTQPLPIIQVPTPLSLALQVTEQLANRNITILVLNNARRDEIYGALVEVRSGLPYLQWESTADLKSIQAKLPTNVKAIVSYDFTANQLPDFESYPWLSSFPSASTTGRLASCMDFPKVTIPQLEPHYVRAAVPKANLQIYSKGSRD